MEFEQNVPTLVQLLHCLLPKADKKLVSFISAVILKQRCKHMSLMQRVFSVMLYGNASHKEVKFSRYFIGIYICFNYL